MSGMFNLFLCSVGRSNANGCLPTQQPGIGRTGHPTALFVVQPTKGPSLSPMNREPAGRLVGLSSSCPVVDQLTEPKVGVGFPDGPDFFDLSEDFVDPILGDGLRWDGVVLLHDEVVHLVIEYVVFGVERVVLLEDRVPLAEDHDGQVEPCWVGVGLGAGQENHGVRDSPDPPPEVGDGPVVGQALPSSTMMVML